MSENSLKESIVHEFSILYSNRIIQKDKKWNDGKLKYYELNHKLEIYNDDGNLIEIDFFDTKNKHQILNNKLKIDNQFKLSNNKLLIEVIEKLSVYKRDISNFFNNSRKNNDKDKIKYENDKIVLNPISDKSLNILVQRHRPVGLRRRAKGGPAIKKEPKIGQVLITNKEHGNKIQIGAEQLKSSKIIKQEQGIIANRPINTSIEESKKSSIINTRKLYMANKMARIPTKSSNYFKYLQSEIEKELNNNVTDGSENIKDALSVSQSTSISPIASNGKFVDKDSGRSHADIVDDFSDFEEDNNFIHKMKEIKETQEQREVVHHTPNCEKFGIITPITGKSKNIYESHEFDLSDNSEFEDIDLQ